MNQNYQNYQDQKYLTEGQLEEDDDEDEEEPTHYNPCFAANNFLGLLLAVFQMMIVIVPYWVDTNSGSSSVLLSDVRIFKGFFVSCLTRHTSQWQCHYQTFDGDFEFYSMRGLQLSAILSCSFSWIAWVLSFYGSECLKILPNETMAKVKSGLVLGAGFFETLSVGFWSAMLSILSSIVKSEFKAELEFDAGKLQRVEDIQNQLNSHMPTDHNYSHNIHKRSGGGGSMQISNDDFKFQPGICYYMAIPTTVLMAIYMVVLFVEGGTRLSSALSDDDVRQSSNNSDVSLLKKETSNRQKSYSKSYGASQQITYRKSNSVQQWRQESSEAQDLIQPVPRGEDTDSWI